VSTATAYELIRSRRSIFSFEDRPVPRPLLQRCLQAATWAPNRGLTQPWRFVVLPPAAVLDAPDEATTLALAAAPVRLAVLQRLAPDPAVRDADRLAVGAAVQNLLLCAWDEGVGGLWATAGPLATAAAGAGADEVVAALLALGYAESVPPVRPRRRAQELTTWPQ